MTLNEILQEGAATYGLALSENALESFRRYYDFLEEKNRVMNLTAITGEADIAALHFLDSLWLLTLESFADKSVIDIGSGAGFPGLPLKIAEPRITLTLLDALQKRVAFMAELTAQLRLPEVTCLHARAEEAALTDLRDSYDFAVSRAVAGLNVLCELCLPFVKPGGVFIAMKGIDSDQEIKTAEIAVKKLGAAIEKVDDYRVAGTDISHRVVLIRKLTETPAGFPRRFAKIQKTPL